MSDFSSSIGFQPGSMTAILNVFSHEEKEKHPSIEKPRFQNLFSPRDQQPATEPPSPNKISEKQPNKTNLLTFIKETEANAMYKSVETRGLQRQQTGG